MVANGFPTVRQIDSPIKSDDSSARFLDQRQQCGIPRQKIDDGYVRSDAINHLFGERQDISAIVIWREATSPTVKQLYGLATSFDLSIEISNQRACETLHQ